MNLSKFLGDAIWDWFFRTVAISSLIVAALGFLDVRSLGECQSHYNEINNHRTRLISQVAESERRAERAADEATRLLFTSPVLDTPASRRTAAQQEEIQRLFRDYQNALHQQHTERMEADLVRQQNPIPPPPSQLCGRN